MGGLQSALLGSKSSCTLSSLPTSLIRPRMILGLASGGVLMGSLSDFLQDNWFELGSLIAQFGIFAVIAWYVRTKLRIATTSHRETEPATIGSEPVDEFVPHEPAAQKYGGVGRMLSPMAVSASIDTVPGSTQRVQRTGSWRGVIRWLRTPMNFGTRPRTAH